MLADTLQMGTQVSDFAIPVISTAFGAIAGYEYKKRRNQQFEEKNNIEQWYDESMNIISRAIYIIYRANIRSDVSDEQVVERLGDLSEQLMIQTSSPPRGVSAESIDMVESLVQVYAKATAVAEVSSEKEGQEVLEELFEMGKKEHHEAADIDAAMENAENIMPGFEELFGGHTKSEFSRQELADTVEEMFNDWDGKEFAQVIASMGDGKEDVNTALAYSIQLLFNMSDKMSQEAYDVLEQERPD